jgi:tetratricopeptide (TPR) repeat protein
MIGFLSNRRWLIGVGFLAFGLLAWWYGQNQVATGIFASAQQAIREGDLVRGRELLDDYLSRCPNDSSARLLAAQTARRSDLNSVFDRHLRVYQELGGDPELIALERILLGIQRGELGNFAGGVRFCRENPQHPEVPLVWEAMTRGYLAQSQFQKAAETASEWLKTDLSRLEQIQAYLWRAYCYQRWAANDLARSDLEAALKLKPDSLEALLALGSLLAQRDPQKAKAIYEAARRIDPIHFVPKLGIARCERILGRFDEAAPLFEALATEAPEQIDLLLERARLAMDLQKPKEAEPFVRTVIRLKPRSLEGHRLLLRILQASGKEEELSEARRELQSIEKELTAQLQEMIRSGAIPHGPQEFQESP